MEFVGASSLGVILEGRDCVVGVTFEGIFLCGVGVVFMGVPCITSSFSGSFVRPSHHRPSERAGQVIWGSYSDCCAS